MAAAVAAAGGLDACFPSGVVVTVCYGSFSGPKREFGLVERVETVMKTVMKGTKVEDGRRGAKKPQTRDGLGQKP